MSTIQDRLLLSKLTLGAWGRKRKHRPETAALNDRHNVRDIATVSVTLSVHPALIALEKLHAEARDAHRDMTLPSAEDGLRLAPGAKQLDIAAALGEFERQHQDCAMQYLAAYPLDRDTAHQRLNGMFDPRHWPSEARLAKSFKFAHKFLPVPSGGAWDDWAAESMGAAEAELRERLTGALTSIQRNCSGDGRLYESLLSNLRSVIEMVPAFALPSLSCAAEADRLAQQSIETLRTSPTARRDAAAEADRLLKIFAIQQP